MKAAIWRSAEDDGGAVVACTAGHLASREAFEDTGGCPYCLRTPGERMAALQAVKATKARLRRAKEKA